LGAKNADSITGIELFDVKGRDGESIGRGWYAQTKCLASMPTSVGMRGIRVRQGNIEIGNEYFLEDSFAERRFATWHVGEIHLCYSVRANARRDGFEQSAEYEAFLEQTRLLGRHLSQLCRASSKKRSQKVSLERMLQKAERLTRQSFAIDDLHLGKTRAELETLLGRLQGANGDVEAIPRFRQRLSAVLGALNATEHGTPYLMDILDGRSLRYVDAKAILGEVAKAIVQHHDGQVSAEDLVMLVVGPYMKKS
jgi:molecular chaperone HtpG